MFTQNSRPVDKKLIFQSHLTNAGFGVYNQFYQSTPNGVFNHYGRHGTKNARQKSGILGRTAVGKPNHRKLSRRDKEFLALFGGI